MAEPRAYHTKGSKLERESQIPYNILIQNLKYHTQKTYLWNKIDSQSHTSDLWLLKWRGVEKGKIGSLGIANTNYYA